MSQTKYQITSQRDLRRAFWQGWENRPKPKRNRLGEYSTDVRCEWCDLYRAPLPRWHHFRSTGTEGDAMNLKFLKTDNGNCRVYYKEGRKLRCFQEDQRDKFTLYVCSSDGEPECEARPKSLQVDCVPEDDCSTSKAFRAWFAKYHEWQTWEG